MENQTKSASAKQLMLWLVLFVNQWQSFMKYSRKVCICTVCYKKDDGDMRQFGASVYFFPDLFFSWFLCVWMQNIHWLLSQVVIFQWSYDNTNGYYN